MDFPCFPYVINAARKTLQTENKPYSTVYVFMIAHVKRWFTSALGHLDCSFQQSFTTGKKARRIKIREITFWTCFRQDLNLNFQSPSFSPALFHRFPAMFRRCLSSECSVFFHVFPGLPVFFSRQHVSLYSLPLPFGKMLQMPKCNK